MEINYRPAGPTMEKFHASQAFIRGVKGPVGSGKTVGMCVEIFRRAHEQARGVDGIRKTRWAITRNTYPELKSTTIKSWLDWFPERVFGKVKWDMPITHHIRINDVDMEVIFLALDRPDDVKKLLSMELTGLWMNEAREQPKAILDAATGRVGRFPSKRDKPSNVPDNAWPTWFGVVLDTNAPDDDHWWYGLAEEPDEVQIAETRQMLEEIGALKPGQPLIDFFSQPSGLAHNAENIKNLPTGYYQRLMAGKTQMWIDVYVHGKYGTVQDGKKVYPEYNDQIHCSSSILLPYKMLPILVSFDYGLTPAAVFQQMTPRGQYRVIDELVAKDMGIRRFGEIVRTHLYNEYPGMKYIAVGDPAGSQRAQTDEKTCEDELTALGFEIEPAPTNAFVARRESVAYFLNRMADGMPGYLLSPKCKVLRKGFNGGYKYRRLQVVGEERYTEEPEKNSYSHPHDAHQYGALKFRVPDAAPKKKRANGGGSSRIGDSTAGY